MYFNDMQLSIILSNLSFIAGIGYLYLGFFVLIREHRSALTRVFFMLAVVLAVWAIGYGFMYPDTNKEVCWRWLRVTSIGWITFSSLLLHFFFNLIGRNDLNRKPLFYGILYLPPAVFLWRSFTTKFVVVDFVWSNFGTCEIQASNDIWTIMFTAYWITYTLAGFILVGIWGAKSNIRKSRKQAFVIVASCILPVFGGLLTNSILPSLGIHFPSIAQILAIIWFLGLWYSISKYRLMVLTPRFAADEIISKVRDLMVLVGPKGTILRINSQVTSVLGYESCELVGRPFTMLLENPEAFGNKFAEEGQTLKYTNDFGIYYKTKSGESIPVSISCEAIWDSVGDLMGKVVVAHDIRNLIRLKMEVEERKQMELALLETNEKLKELDKMKTDFLSTVSHELRTPLTSILGFAKIIKKKFEGGVLPALKEGDAKAVKNSNQIMENVNIIISEGERLTALINDVLDIAKMEAGRTEWKMQEVSVGEIIEKSLAATSSLFEQKGLEMRKDIDENLPVIYGDEDRLMQVVINLISNSVKFTDIGYVKCCARKSDNRVIISVTDTGMGIAEADQNAVFEKFKQVGDTLTNKPKGTGLGLPICKQIVEHHGGRIWVESQIGKGSSFSISLPVDGRGNDTVEYAGKNTVSKVLEEASMSSDAEAAAVKGRVLVVDDDNSIRSLLTQELRNRGYDTIEAKEGIEAINQTRKNIPDVIILDVLMPNLNGFDVAAVLRNDLVVKHIPIVYLSVFQDRNNMGLASKDRYFVKPVNIESLINEIDSIIGK